MSTKTTFKRVAAVAAAALAISGFSAVSAHAVTPLASTITQVANTGDHGVGGIAGPNNTLQVTITDAATDTPTVKSNLRTFISVTGGTITAAATGTNTTSPTIPTGGTSSVTQAVGTDTSLAASVVYTIVTPTVGSIVVNTYDETAVGSGLYAATPSATKTLTISAASVVGTVSPANSTSILTADTTAAGILASTATTDATVVVS